MDIYVYHQPDLNAHIMYIYIYIDMYINTTHSTPLKGKMVKQNLFYMAIIMFMGSVAIIIQNNYIKCDVMVFLTYIHFTHSSLC